MKVLILSHNYPNSAQVAKGKFVSEQVRFLAKNCEIKVISPVPYAPPIKFFKKWYFLRSIAKVEIYEGIEVFHPRYILFPKKILFNFAGYFMYFGIHKTVKTLLNSWDCDIVHAHFSFPDGFAGMKIAQKFKKIFIITEHFGAFNEMIKNRFLKKSTRMVFEESKKVFVVSSDLKKSIESMNIDVSKIYELPNGVDVNKFICSNVKLELKFKIIAIGNFVPVKGFMLLLKAIQNIIRKGYNIEFTLIGDGVLRDDYVDFINNNNLSEFIKLPGYLQHQEIADYLSKSHICVSSSYKESFGVTIIESLACGVPVVVTNSGGPDKFVNKISGIIVERGNVEALSEGIISIMQNYSKYSKNEIRKYCISKFDYNVIVNKMITIYKKEINEKNMPS